MADGGLTAALIISAVVSAGTAIYSGQQQSKMAKYNAKVAENQATATRQAAEKNASMRRRQNEQMLAEMENTMSQNGYLLEGSALAYLGSQAAEMEHDAQMIIYNGDTEAMTYSSQAAGYRMKASAASTSGYMNAGAALINGATSYYTADAKGLLK